MVSLPGWRRLRWPLLALAYLLLAYSPRHYWDEYFYLVSLRDHPPAALFALEPHLGGLFPAGFFTAKSAFVLLLHRLIAWTGDGATALGVIRGVFALGMLAFLGAARGLLGELLPRRRADGAALLVALSPLALYLGYKTLSEVPSLLFTTLGGWAFLAAFRAGGRGRAALCLAGAVAALTLGLASRFPALLGFGAMLAGLLLFDPRRYPGRRVLAWGAGVCVAVLASWLLLWLAWVDAPLERLAGLVSNLSGRRESPLLKLYAVLITVQAFLPFAARPLLSRWDGLTRLAAVWLVLATLPFLAGSAYAEPRFLYLGLLPLGLLTWRGYELLAAGGRRRRRAAGMGLAAAAALNWGLLVPLMPYEIHEARYARLLADRAALPPGATLLTPWLSDYGYLAFAHPRRRLRLVLTWAKNGDPRFYRSVAFRRWVGEGRYLADLDGLAREPRPWRYLGWAYNPLLGEIHGMLRALGLAAGGLHYSPNQKNHLCLSWIAGEPALASREIARVGTYRVFDLTPLAAARGPAPRALPASCRG